jgi:hypothetical protein
MWLQVYEHLIFAQGRQIFPSEIETWKTGRPVDKSMTVTAPAVPGTHFEKANITRPSIPATHTTDPEGPAESALAVLGGIAVPLFLLSAE